MIVDEANISLRTPEYARRVTSTTAVVVPNNMQDTPPMGLCRDVRAYGHTTTAMHDIEDTSLPPPGFD